MSEPDSEYTDITLALVNRIDDQTAEIERLEKGIAFWEDKHIENEQLKAVIKEIAVFGRNNPGRGYTCATMAIKSMKEDKS